jgi:uncharacterized protein (TIGR00661 family)
MKILYAIQGTGNGHMSRALDIIPLLKRKAQVDLLVSGVQADLTLPYPVKYRFNGFSYIFGKKGGINFWETWKHSDFFQLCGDIWDLPVTDYHLIISDFEPISAWACMIRGVKAVGLSHQNAVIHPDAPKPAGRHQGSKWVLRYYAPTAYQYGFHFKNWGKGIFTPVIRETIRDAVSADEGHITVYLPAYKDEKIMKVLGKIEGVRWEVFSKHNLEEIHYANLSIYPINNEKFVKSLVNCHGVLCGAGFETPAEALFLKKKLMVIPMKSQYEQHCNAAALKSMGVPVIKSLKKKYLQNIEKWITSADHVSVTYSNQTPRIINTILKRHLKHSINGNCPERMQLGDYRRLAFS